MIKPSRGKCMSDGWETARRLDRPNVIEANDDGTMKITGKYRYYYNEFKQVQTIRENRSILLY